MLLLSTLLILAVRRAYVIHEPRICPSLPPVSLSLVVRASDQCAEGHRFDSGIQKRFFVPRS